MALVFPINSLITDGEFIAYSPFPGLVSGPEPATLTPLLHYH